MTGSSGGGKRSVEGGMGEIGRREEVPGRGKLESAAERHNSQLQQHQHKGGGAGAISTILELAVEGVSRSEVSSLKGEVFC